MSKFVKLATLTEEEKKQVSEQTSKIMLWVLEGRSVGYMSEQLHLPPWQIESNIETTLYVLRKQVGLKRFIRTLFFK